MKGNFTWKCLRRIVS